MTGWILIVALHTTLSTTALNPIIGFASKDACESVGKDIESAFKASYTVSWTCTSYSRPVSAPAPTPAPKAK